MQTSTWYGCYDETLKAFITPASFAHPAKMAKRLCELIYEHGAEQGYWQPGDLILDPFGGIGTTGLIGAYRGYRVISIELEPHFVALHQANIEKNTPKLKRLGLPLPIVTQGDSRQTASLLLSLLGIGQGEGVSGQIFFPPYADGAAHTGGDDLHPERMTGGTFHGVGLLGAISSPPYAHSVHDGNGIDVDKLTGNTTGNTSQALNDGYGKTAGQSGSLREGDFDHVVGVVSSPQGTQNGIDWSKLNDGGKRQTESRAAYGGEYGISAGQIGALREGEFERVVGAVTSPPFEDTLSRDVVNAEARREYARSHGISNAEHVSPVDMERIGARDQEYGHTDGQIGTLSGGFDEVIGAITSPPYESSVNQSAGANDSTSRIERKAQAGVDVSQAVKRGGPNSVLNQPQVYGATTGQIGSEKAENYWQAMAQVYSELYRVLQPSGMAAIVCKDFVRNKQIVPLCDRTAQLLEALGFTIIERTHAMLTKETPLGLDMFTGAHASKTTSRKSFFRRLAEKNGSPAIDYEEILWAQKISSPSPFKGEGRGEG